MKFSELLDQRISDIWNEYEYCKQEIIALNLPPDEYEKAIQELADRLGI